MKKLKLFLVIMIIAILAACGGGNDSESKNNNDVANVNQGQKENDGNNKNENNNNENTATSVNKGEKTITIPFNFVLDEEDDEDLFEEEIKQMQEEIEAYGGTNFSYDGENATFNISEADHQKMMKEFEAEILLSFNEFINNEEYESIKNIEANDDFSEFKITIDVDVYEDSLYDGFAIFGIALSSSMYQIYDGKDPDNMSIKIELIDSVSGEVYEQLDTLEGLFDM